MTTIALFGASGKTGLEIIACALEKNFAINAFCRHKSSIPYSNNNLNIIEGDVTNYINVRDAINNTHYVICTLGTKAPYTDVFCYEAAKNILNGMEIGNVKRLICITGAMVGDYHENLSFFMKWMQKSFNKRFPLISNDRENQESAVIQSFSDWTIIKPSRLTNLQNKNYKMGEKLRVTSFSSISRKTMASLIINILENKMTFRKILFVKS